jgi:hypothetical protein
MIPTNELRIRNLVQLNEEILTVETIFEYTNDFHTRNKNGKSLYNSIQVQPIPLTQEWLEKFGARYYIGTVDSYYLPLTNLKCELHFEVYVKNNGQDIVTTIKGQFCELILDPIKAVHQLQNLYFTLAGDELTLK